MFVSKFRSPLGGALFILTSLAATSATATATSPAQVAAPQPELLLVQSPDALTCGEGATVTRSRPLPGMARYTCTQPTSASSPVATPDGQELMIAGQRCADGRQHIVQVLRHYSQGVQDGEEIGFVDGAPAYRLQVQDGRVAAVVVLRAGARTVPAGRCGGGPMRRWATSPCGAWPATGGGCWRWGRRRWMGACPTPGWWRWTATST